MGHFTSWFSSKCILPSRGSGYSRYPTKKLAEAESMYLILVQNVSARSFVSTNIRSPGHPK